MLQFIVNVIAKGHLDQVELFQLVPQTKTVVQSAKPKKIVIVLMSSIYLFA